MKMRQESVNTADGTTAQADPSSLPVPLEPPVIKRQPSHLGESRGRTRKKQLNSTGLSCLDSVDLISIELDQSCLSCRLDKSYSIRDVTGDKVILKGVQDFNPFSFSFGGLRNVILRDAENLPVARVCFKQKSPLYPSMALAVYAPCDVLVGTGEETSGVFMFTSRLLLRNADGDELFNVEYNNKILSSNYSIKSFDEPETADDVAKIVLKSRHRVRLQTTSKMNTASKIVLIGFCIGLVNKFTPPNKNDD